MYIHSRIEIIHIIHTCFFPFLGQQLYFLVPPQKNISGNTILFQRHFSRPGGFSILSHSCLSLMHLTSQGEETGPQITSTHSSFRREITVLTKPMRLQKRSEIHPKT